MVILGAVFANRIPRSLRLLLGPLGVAAAALAVATLGDGAAIFYAWPLLWMTFLFGRGGARLALACIAVAQAALVLAPAVGAPPLSWVAVMLANGVIALVILMFRARYERLLARLEGEARTDALTGLLNRRGFDERAELELVRARRQRTPIAVCAFDIDHFKRVNDEWGHEVGDRVLARVARVIAANSREVDVVARFGGEEFVVLVPGADSAGARTYAERVRRALAADEVRGLPPVRLSAGVHAAHAPATLEPLLQAADAALYQAKRAGRDRTVVCDWITAATAAA